MEKNPCQDDFSGAPFKDTLTKGQLSNKGRIIWQQVTWIPSILPITKGHLSNKDRIIWSKGCPY